MSELNLSRINTLLALMSNVQELRGPKGCPWDKEQTHQSLIPYALDEIHELIETLQEIPRNDFRIKDELGDVLFQVLIHSEIAKEEGRFDFLDVVENLSQKLIRRHPHVFNFSGKVTKENVLERWEEIKAEERQLRGESPPEPQVFKTPRYLTALQRAQAIGIKTEFLKFDWSKPEEVFDKVLEETEELKAGMQANDSENIEEEIGDLFFVLTQLCRKLGIDAEETVQKANKKFISRFNQMIDKQRPANSERNSKNLQIAIDAFTKLTLEEKEALWSKVKSDSL